MSVELAHESARSVADRRISAEVLVGIGPFASLKNEWIRVFDRSRTQNPFLSWEWVSAWVEHFCGERLRTVVVRERERTIAIAPFHLNRYLIGPGLYTNALQLLGPKEVQHLFEMREILAEPGYEALAMAAILDRVATGSGYDWIELSAYGSGLATLTELLEARNDGRFKVEVGPMTEIPVVALEDTWDAQRQKLKRNIKESIRHCYNSLRRDGHAHLYLADGGEADARAAAARLVDLHHQRALLAERRWHRDHFADDAIRAFELDVLRRMHDAGRLRFAEVTIDGQVVANRACLQTHGSVYLYYSGFDPAWWKYSVMTLLVTETIREAIANGMSNVNFSPGIDDSKSRWSPELIPMRSITLVRTSAVSRARHRALKVRKQIRQPLHRRLDQALSLFRGGSAQ